MANPTGRAAGALWLLCTLVAAPAVAAQAAGTVCRLSSPVALDLRWIPAGEFTMGDRAGVGQADERPLRTVALNGFWLMATEVSVGLFSAYAKARDVAIAPGCGVFQAGWTMDTALDWRNPGFAQGPRHPVTCVSWQDAVAFAEFLSDVTGQTFFLPSESQWEYAARAGSGTRFAHGDNVAPLCRHANGADQQALRDYPGFSVNQCDDGFVRTAPVGSFAANAWGLADMTGNVWEWVADCWHTDYAAAPSDGSAFETAGCSRRGFRGGAYGDVPFFLRIALRNRGAADARKDDVGFRLAARLAPGWAAAHCSAMP